MRINITWYFLVGIILLLPFGTVEAQESADIRYTIDQELPKVYCINGLAINFTDKNRSRTITAREINLGSSDNIGIKTLKLEEHRPDATAPDSDATDLIRFTAKDLGKYKIDLWVEDFGGNWARKSTYVLVADLVASKGVVMKEVTASSYPNPFADRTEIRFEMNDTGPAEISILSSSGNLIKEIKAIYPKGKQVVEINKSDLPSVGVYYYQIITKQGTVTKNMIMVNY